MNSWFFTMYKDHLVKQLYGYITIDEMFKEKEKKSIYINVNKMLHSSRIELAKQLVCSWAIEQKL